MPRVVRRLIATPMDARRLYGCSASRICLSDEIVVELGMSQGAVEKDMVREPRLPADLLSMPEEPLSTPGGALDLSRIFSNEQ